MNYLGLRIYRYKSELTLFILLCFYFVFVSMQMVFFIVICVAPYYFKIIFIAYRFYIKCTACVSEICFRTDPENTDYVLESGINNHAWPCTYLHCSKWVFADGY